MRFLKYLSDFLIREYSAWAEEEGREAIHFVCASDFWFPLKNIWYSVSRMHPFLQKYFGQILKILSLDVWHLLSFRFRFLFFLYFWQLLYIEILRISFGLFDFVLCFFYDQIFGNLLDFCFFAFFEILHAYFFRFSTLQVPWFLNSFKWSL